MGKQNVRFADGSNMETRDTQSRNKPVSYTIPVFDQFKTPIGLQQPSLRVKRSSDIDSDSDVDDYIVQYRSMGKRRYVSIRGKVSKLHTSDDKIQQLRDQNAQIGQVLQSVVDRIGQTGQYGQVLQSLVNRVDDLADSIAVSSPCRPTAETQQVDNTDRLVDSYSQ